MRIEDLAREERDGAVRVRAAVVWEDCARPREDVYIEAPRPAGDDLEARPDAFLLAGIVPAMDRGERRLRVEGALCPELLAGLAAIFAELRVWFPALQPPAVESDEPPRPRQPRRPPRVASFLSGGVDSLATLRMNRLRLPRDHPGAIEDGVCLYGMNTFEFDATGAPDPRRLADHQARLRRLAAVARDADVEIVPVTSNLRWLAPDYESWQARGHGAGLAAIAHAFGRRLTRALIASGGLHMSPPEPNGSHRLLDPHFSSASVEIRNDGFPRTRLHHTAIVADWPAGLAALQPCLRLEPLGDRVNCGDCRKCVRTRIHLAACGALERAAVFAGWPVTAETIAAHAVTDAFEAEFLAQALPGFERLGRHDLAAAVRARLARYAWHEECRRFPGWTGRLRLTSRRLVRKFERLIDGR